MAEFLSTWKEFTQLVRELAPKQLEVLQPACMPSDIAELEDSLEISLPDDYRQWLLLHNGCKPGNEEATLVSFRFLPINEVIRQTQQLRGELLESSDAPAALEAGGWSKTAVMIGNSFVGWDFAMDTDDGAPRVYQRHGYALPSAASFEDYISGMIHNIRIGEYEVHDSGLMSMPEWGERLGSSG